jgi:DNA/RNA-binding domain of Phe-tRNA-synthetase-like protein
MQPDPVSSGYERNLTKCSEIPKPLIMVIMMRYKSRMDPDKLLIGIVEAENTEIDKTLPELDTLLNKLLEKRKNGLTGDAEAFRLASRDMLRHGKYKPTGRAKPASEYLLRTAEDDSFPRINTAVDINNYISLKYMVPISLWDDEKTEGKHILFDTGSEGEKYVFNESGQEIEVKDLVCGFLQDAGDRRIPVINPVKDSMRTKTSPTSKNIGYAVYYPVKAGSLSHLQQILDEIAGLLKFISGGTVTNCIAEYIR